MGVIKAIWNAIKGLFVGGTKSTLVTSLITNSKSALSVALADSNLGSKAIDLVKELNNNDQLTTAEKAETFNNTIGAIAKNIGSEVTKSNINLIRELAVEAVKTALTK